MADDEKYELEESNTELTKGDFKEEDGDREILDEFFNMDTLKNDAQKEVADVLIDRFLPRLKMLAPKAIKIVDEDHELLVSKSEMICIWRADDTGEVFVMKGSKDNLTVNAKNIEECDINDLGGMFEMFMDFIKKTRE